MAYAISRTLAELKQECRDLNINVEIEGRETKADYVEALQESYLCSKHNSNPSKHLRLRMNLESPMLAQRYKVLKDEEQQELWQDKNRWYFEKKMDGVRMLMVYTSEVFDFFSRNLSVEDYLPISYQDTVNTAYIDKSVIKDDFILDTEVISLEDNINTAEHTSGGVITETQLQAITAMLALEGPKSIAIQKELDNPIKFYAFDCIWWNGEWLMDKSLRERRKYLRKAIQQLKDAGVKIDLPPASISNKKAFYRAIVKGGGEGVISKNINYEYIPTSSRRREGWIKIKRSMAKTLEMEGIGDTIEAFVSGFDPGDPEKDWAGMVGAIHFSVYLESGDDYKEHKIAKVSGIPMELREEITEVDEMANLRMKRGFYGRVASIDGQCVTARAKRLKHAVIDQWRPDKSPEDCTMERDFLESMIL